MARNRALAAYVARNGKPDLAESRELADRPPWDDHEVTLYYLGIRKEIGFARAWILGQPTVHLERYERPLSDADVAALSKRARQRPADKGRPASVDPAPGSPPAAAGAAEHAEGAAPRAEAAAGPAERAEQAAQRAEAAASRLEAAAAEAEHAADRAEAASDAMETAVQTARRK